MLVLVTRNFQCEESSDSVAPLETETEEVAFSFGRGEDKEVIIINTAVVTNVVLIDRNLVKCILLIISMNIHTGRHFFCY